MASWSSSQSEVKDVVKSRINRWYNEVKDFDPNHISPFVYTRWPKIGHYTQVVWAETEEVGCGISNYKVRGNMRDTPMYKKGTAGSACPAGYTSDDGLCSSSNAKSCKTTKGKACKFPFT